MNEDEREAARERYRAAVEGLRQILSGVSGSVPVLMPAPVSVVEIDVDMDAEITCQTIHGPCDEPVGWMIRWHRPCGHPPVLGYCEDHGLMILSRLRIPRNGQLRYYSCRFCHQTEVYPVAWWRA